jgi:secondary thiamine-phosphate synthase enzyme
MRFETHCLAVDTPEGIGILDVTPDIRKLLGDSNMQRGFAVISSKHTTTALGINEFEERLLDDIKSFLSALVPANRKYKHNDIELRECPEDEPANAHSHITALLLGSSESIPIDGGELQIGQWQSVLLFELDGPRNRTLNVQLIGE